jgi:hypothetical protein
VNYVNDTNILVLTITNPKFQTYYEETYLQNFQQQDRLVISTVTQGELKALAIGPKWGIKKMQQLDRLLTNHASYPVKMECLSDVI